MHIKYRPDIDGLRAIAVLAVIFNHIGSKLFSGGFVGVDVFFVISGYLITAIIVEDINNAKFSLVKFYERRIRRILPALLATLLATAAICLSIYPPEQFAQFGKDLFATSLFFSNINFWKESGYFAAASQLKPLLHTWSLAVEEQFYIFFPLALIGLMRFFKKGVFFTLLVTALLSLGLSVLFLARAPSGVFYLTHFRIWELLIGGLLSLNIKALQITNKQSEALGIVGLLLVATAILLYSKDTSFPGLSALAPVIGTAFIILSGDQYKSITRKLLSFPPLIYIGKISYSLYLWHWPVIVFSKTYSIRPLTGLETSLIAVGIFSMASLSWRYIEMPFRGQKLLNTMQIFSLATASIILISLTGFIIYKKNGFPLRDWVSATMTKLEGNGRWRFEKCDVNYGDPTDLTFCEIGDPSKEPSFLVWGDSHTPALGKGLHISAAKAGVSGLLSYDPGCPSLLEMTAYPLRGNLPCADYNNLIIQYLSEHPKIKTVILINRWNVWAEGLPYKDEEGPSVYKLVDGSNEIPETSAPEDLFALGLERTIQGITKLDRKIVIVAPIPEVGYDVSAANFIALKTNRDANQIIAPTLDEYLRRSAKTFGILNYFKQTYHVQIAEPWKILCANSICRVTIDGLPLYKDDDHLSVFGSEFVAPAFDPIFMNVH